MQIYKRLGKKPSYLILALVLVLALCASVLTPAPAHAQSWPTSWIHIDSDPNESGTQNDYRDVVRSYYNYDATYLYLRLETYDPPQFPNVGARFKWLIDVGLGSNMYWSGQNILGSDYILMVEDSDNDGGRDVYLLDAQGNDKYTQYEPSIYKTNPGPVTDTSIAGFRTIGNFVDLYVSFSALGVPDASHLSLVWATDQENPNLEQGPIVDSMDFSDTPFHVDANVRVLKDVDNHTPAELDNVQYTVTVTNTGPADATNIEVTDLLPGGVTYVPPYSASQGNYDNITGIWLVGDLINGASATLTITANVDAGTGGSTITNTATITDVDQPDSYLDDNYDFANIFPAQAAPNQADLAVIKMVNDHLPIVGDTIVYTITVINTGPDDATRILLTDLLPGEVTYQSYSASQGTYDNGSGIWSIGDLADEASAILTITGIANCACGSTVFNTATITSVDQFDPHEDDNYGIAEFIARAPTPTASRGVPVFPSMYVGLAAALGAGVLAYILRRKVSER